MLEENSDREGGDRNGERRSREIVKNHNVPNLSSAAGWSLKYWCKFAYTWDIDSARNNSERITMIPHGLAPARIPVCGNPGERNVNKHNYVTNYIKTNLLLCNWDGFLYP